MAYVMTKCLFDCIRYNLLTQCLNYFEFFVSKWCVSFVYCKRIRELLNFWTKIID
jgi:hypothetical protein